MSDNVEKRRSKSCKGGTQILGMEPGICTALGYETNVNYRLKKVKCTLVQALRLCTGRTAHRGSRGIALLFHDHGTSWG